MVHALLQLRDIGELHQLGHNLSAEIGRGIQARACKFHRIIRYVAGTVDAARKPGIVGSINGYDYLHMTPQAACGTTTAEQQVEVAENFKVNALLKTIEAKQ